MVNTPKLPWQHIHILGMGGTGLSAIARVLLDLGYRVSGCDRQDNSVLRALAQQGARVMVGHDPGHLEDVDVLLVTSAAPEDHPEVVAARERGIPVLKRRDFLPYVLAGRQVVAVAGTHGKTTTTAMIVHMLRELGREVGYIIGSVVPRWGNAAAGSDSVFVIEADEYDYMFWGLTPTVAVVTNVEWDHVDCFPTREAYIDAFVTFAGQAQSVVACADDAGARLVAQRSQANVITYGFALDARWRPAYTAVTSAGGWQFIPVRDGVPVAETVVLQVPGRHNVLNALAALAALDAIGVRVEQAAPHLASYQGAGRRFEIKGEVNGVVVVDDYAHHPTEVRATLAAAREMYPRRRVWAIFQPHTYSRTRALLPQWREAFADADEVAVMEIYAARETDTLGLSGEAVAEAIHHPRVRFTGDVMDTVSYVRARVRPGDVVITLGAGTSVKVAEALVRHTPVWRDRLSVWRKVLEGDFVAENVPLAPYTTFRIGGPADVLAVPTHRERFVALMRSAAEMGIPFLVLGGGSNVLIPDEGIRGLVIINRCRSFEVIPGEGEWVYVRVDAGVSLAGLARETVRQGLDGLTWAVSIPGTVGGAVVGNAGAHGGSMAEVVEWVHVLQEDGQVVRVPGEALAYGYRTSTLKEARQQGKAFPVVVDVMLRLRRGDARLLRQQADAFLDHRRRTQPTESSVGSIFRNPPGDYAGRLIEAAGLKGVRVGDVAVSTVHANFIVNLGNGRAADVRALMRIIQERVRQQFGVHLEPEILILKG